MEVARLNEKFGIPNRLNFQCHSSGLIFGDVETESSRATFFLHGAQVTAFQPKGDPHPWLFLSRHTSWDEQSPIRGGIPICFPWFGKHSLDPTAPSHGLVRTKSWKVVSSKHEQGMVEVTLELVVGLFQLHYHIAIGPTLSIALSIRNLAEIAQAAEVALHSYFPVSHIQKVSIHGLEELGYLDQLTGIEHDPTGRPITFAAETDRIYQGEAKSIQLEDLGWNRTLVLASDNARSTVVWNPWIDKSRRLPDFGDDEYLQMCCIETANLAGLAVHLESSEQRTVALTIRSKT